MTTVPLRKDPFKLFVLLALGFLLLLVAYSAVVINQRTNLAKDCEKLGGVPVSTYKTVECFSPDAKIPIPSP